MLAGPERAQLEHRRDQQQVGGRVHLGEGVGRDLEHQIRARPGRAGRVADDDALRAAREDGAADGGRGAPGASSVAATSTSLGRVRSVAASTTPPGAQASVTRSGAVRTAAAHARATPRCATSTGSAIAHSSISTSACERARWKPRRRPSATSVMRARYAQASAGARVGRTSTSRRPPSRASCSATRSRFAARWAGVATCCHWQPPHCPNTGQRGATRSGPARTTSETVGAQEPPALLDDPRADAVAGRGERDEDDAALVVRERVGP